MTHRIAAAVAASLFAGGVFAQTAPIERSKMGDNELTCAQLHAEAGTMDKIIAEAQAAQAQGSNTATAGTVANTAAQVAGQTGLFGQLGGLAGALFGQAAAQTAAGVATQTGQQSAQQAAERTRQATARKDNVTQMFLARGCKVSDLAYNPPAPAPAANAAPQPAPGGLGMAPGAGALQVPAVPAPAPVTSLPDIDPDKHFRGKMGGTFGANVTEVLPNSRRVMIAGFRVGFITHNTVSAQVRASYLPGRDTSGARSTLNLTLNGVDAATMQALTDRAYADFLTQMKLAGREVVPPEELKGLWSSLETKEAKSDTFQFFSPKGVPLWFTGFDDRFSKTGVFEQANANRIAEYSTKLNAIALAPIIVVNFANMLTSGNQSGLTARAAETGAELSMRVTGFSSLYTRSEEFRNGIMMKGDGGGIDISAPVVSPLAFGSMKEVSSSDNNAARGIANAFGALAGLANAGGAARSTSNHVAETNNEAYAAAAADALNKATGTFARLFQKYPPKQ
jgi:hypothetical protein